jgi:hypothetical protein
VTVLAELVREVSAEDGLLAGCVRPAEDDGDTRSSGPAQVAAAGPRAAGRRADYELLVELIYEGYLLHYGAGRVVRPEEPDLALLAGDQLYALGLVRLAGLGDLDAVAELADAISLCAQARAADDTELADAVWAAAGVAVGHGGGPALSVAKDAARRGDPGAAAALREVARSG